MYVVHTRETNHGLAQDSTHVTEQVVEYLIKCMNYHQLKKVIIHIDYTISTYCRKKIEIVHK